MSLSKNPKFHRLPDQSWGLREWYPNIPKKATADKAKADEGKDKEDKSE
jgi:DNA-directed RNA polymerase delta subunit